MTAAERLTELFDQLAGQPQVRLIDVRRDRRLTGQQLARGYRKALSRLPATPIRVETPTLFAVRPPVTALFYLCALISVGVPIVLTDLALPSDLVKTQLARASSSTALTSPVVYFASLKPVRWLIRNRIQIPDLHQIVPTLATTRPRRSRQVVKPPPAEESTALIAFTSGTTDLPKAVIHSQRTLGDMLESIATLMGQADDVVAYSDQFHSLLPALKAGARCVTGTPNMSDSHLGEVLQRHAVDVWFTTPSRARRVASLIGDATPGHLVLGSAPVTPALIDELKYLSPRTRITAVYGMTEAVPVAIAEQDEIVSHDGPGNLLGHVVEGIDIRVADDGEFWLTGSRVGHYLDETPGWIPTGDVGRIDNQGRLILDGRSKDMIIKDSRNIYPHHFEPYVNAVDGILEAAIVGVADAYGNEAIWVVVEADKDQGVIVQSVKSLPELESLEIDGLVFASLPKGRQGKLDRKSCQRLVEQAVNNGTAVMLPKSS